MSYSSSHFQICFFILSHLSGHVSRPLVVLHCHGNATDIGMMMGPYYELSKVLGIEAQGI